MLILTAAIQWSPDVHPSLTYPANHMLRRRRRSGGTHLMMSASVPTVQRTRERAGSTIPCVACSSGEFTSGPCVIYSLMVWDFCLHILTYNKVDSGLHSRLKTGPWTGNGLDSAKLDVAWCHWLKAPSPVDCRVIENICHVQLFEK